MRHDRRNTYRRLKIGDALRQFREERGLTQHAAGRLLERSQASLSAYENGHRAIRPRDLKHILDQYGVTDELIRRRLLALASHGRQKGWWHDFEERLEPGVLDFASLEADASHIRIFGSQLVHGLFQTEEYAHTVISGSGMALRSPPDLETEIGFRMNRQRVHDRADPPVISAVFSEAVFRQEIGGAGVMRRQGLKLLAMAERPNVEIQVLPFSAGMHPGGDGAFTILGLGQDRLLEVVAVDSLTRSWYIDEPSDVDHYGAAFNRLRDLALCERDSRALIERIVSEV
ncbi:helix-turn-helix transcriptional regulator [Actinomadura viridis]|uniref:Transcriptional regulator with XRE-family HTH domain n=1 Tax=Actinomadura viridis TaxID=58110 RepID=A0A931GJV5_9ACTN|nr:helix-turn-helix transcriptional regulator [Actinomadura viridis]MBG6090153.1 transcriptional regulator with XRE-family HTH domain [Actinomadura viridis]